MLSSVFGSAGRVLRVAERGFARALVLLDPVCVPLQDSHARLAVDIQRERLNRRFRTCGPDVNILAPDLILGHEYIDIGKGVHVHPRCRWEVVWLGEGNPRPGLEIGTGTNAGFNLNICCSSRVRIGRHVIFASNVLLSDAVHNYENTELPIMSQGVRSAGPVVVEDGCWIGFGAVILPNVIVGRQSVVGSGAVVTRSIPPFSVAVGNPARVVRSYDPESRQWKTVA